MVLFKRSASSNSYPGVGFGDDELQFCNNFKQRQTPSSYQSFKRDGKKKTDSFSIQVMLQYVAIVLLLIQCYRTTGKVSSANESLTQLQEMYDETHNELLVLEDELDGAHEDFHKLQMKLLAGQSGVELTHPSEVSDERREYIVKKVIEKQDHQSERISSLQKSLQKSYEIELDRRFGKGPHYVEFTLTVNGNKKFMTIEMAPNHVMPHSVYNFLDMIENKVWDNTIFTYRNHVVSAALMDNQMRPKNVEESLQHKLAFPEYSHEFDHDEFSIGFAGLGPNFYVNTKDNISLHGPGKQPHSKLMNDADPCFAKIVIGYDAFDKFKEQPNGGAKQFATIHTAKIIKLSKERQQKLASSSSSSRK